MESTSFCSADTLSIDDYEPVWLHRRTKVRGEIPEEEILMMEHLSDVESLRSVRELATSKAYFSLQICSSIRSSIRRQRNRDNYETTIIRGLEDMGLPNSVLDFLRFKNFPLTQIQIEALSVAVSGRDMIGISFTGSGTSLMFVLPLVMAGLKEEVFMPISRKEGPFGLILCPSAELATHVFQLVEKLVTALQVTGNPWLGTLLCVDRKDMRLDIEIAKMGVHIIVATPGRLNLMVASKIINLDSCRCLALNKADLLLDKGFEHDMQSILGSFKGQSQTLLFCANMTPEVENFARISLVKPVTVNARLCDLTENVNAITIDDVRN